MTDDKLQQMSEMDMKGWTKTAMAKELGVTRVTLDKHLKRLREERRQSRNEGVDEFLHQLDLLIKEQWSDSRHTDEKGRPNTAAARLVLDAIKQKTTLLGLGSTTVKVDSENVLTPQVVNVVVNTREEVEKAMSLDVFKSKLIGGADDVDKQ